MCADLRSTSTYPCYNLPLKLLDELFSLLQRDGFQIIGPTLQDGAIRYEQVHCSNHLICGYVDHQSGGAYHLKSQGDLYFGYTVPQDSWRRHLQRPVETIWRSTRSPAGFDMKEILEPLIQRVFWGVRPCELRAIEIQDQVFLKGNYVEPHYRRQREDLFLVVANCIRATSTCFCTSMGVQPFLKGPENHKNPRFDLVLTELEGRSFLVRTGSSRALTYIQKLGLQEAVPEDLLMEEELSEKVHSDLKKNRGIEQDHLKEIMNSQLESPYWNHVAQRCLSCSNCTLVCPTCFCSTTEDVIGLDENTTERVRRWDSCFDLSHSYIHGGSVRKSVSSRYRQWITHKLVTWDEQFGTPGCVGCGRCITWCPVGIDIREEVKNLKALWLKS